MDSHADLVGYSLWGHKELDTAEVTHAHILQMGLNWLVSCFCSPLPISASLTSLQANIRHVLGS